MKYRLILFLILVIILAVFFASSTRYVLNQVESSHLATARLHLITAIEFIESGTDSFFREEAIRVSDWSSDGTIRETTEKIAEGKANLEETLGAYIKTRKMPLDSYVLAAEVVDVEGHLLASTVDEKGMEENHLASFDSAIVSGLKFGDHTFSLPIFEEHHGVNEQLMVHFVAPLFSLHDESKRLGFLIIHVRLDSFFGGLSRENIKTTFGNPKLYLFDQTGRRYLPKEDTMMSKKEVGDILALCRSGEKKDEGFIRESSDAMDAKTVGAIICTSHGWWIPYIVADENAIMSKFMQGKNNIALTLGFFFLITILLYAIVEFDTSKKIGAIVKVLGDVATGNLRSRVAVESSFFSEIIKSINSTIDSLEKTSGSERELQKLYRTLTDSSPISIKLFDQSGRVVFLNKHAKKELGIPDDADTSHFDFFERIDPRDRAMLKEKIEATLRDGARSDFEFRHIQGRGNEYCNGFLAPVVDASGAREGAIFSSVDATDRKKAEERIGSLERVKNEFVSIAAHQIRTPITAILGASEELQSEANLIPEKDRELVRMIGESVRKLNDFITFLLSATRAESGATKFHLSSFDLKALTEEVIATLRSDIEGKKLIVEVDAVPNPLPSVYTDREVVRQVIQNLISNAIRYSRAEGKISVALTLKGQSIEYAVRDSGIGIPASAQDRIFGKFFRADNAKKESPEGTGLGLSFSKSLVESWGGEIWFESSEGKGSTFFVTIPIVGTEESKSRILL